MTQDRLTRSYRVHGRVQGVGFRFYVWKELQECRVAGWVRNRRDGTVEVLVKGTPADHERVRQILAAGPRFSRVDRVDESEGEAADVGSGFAIRHST